MTTSKRVARIASKELRSSKSTKPERRVAGSALSQAKRTTRRTTKRSGRK